MLDVVFTESAAGSSSVRPLSSQKSKPNAYANIQVDIERHHKAKEE